MSPRSPLQRRSVDDDDASPLDRSLIASGTLKATEARDATTRAGRIEPHDDAAEHGVNFTDAPRTERPQPSGRLELRVLGGPQAGASLPWPRIGEVLVLQADDTSADPANPTDSRAPSADLMLHSDRPARLRLRVGAGQEARVEVLDGDAWIGDVRHTAGTAFDWPLLVPMQLGASVAIAVGAVDAPIWPLAGLTVSDADPAAPDTNAPVEGDTRDDEDAALAAVPPRGRLDAWLAGGGALLGVAGLVWSLLVTLPTAPQAAVPPPQIPWDSAQAVLREPDFAGLTLDRQADGQARLSGRLATRGQALRLQARMATWPARPQWQVQVDEALAASVEDALQVQGVPWRATVTGLGAVRLDGPADAVPSDRLARALADLRAALPQIRQLEVPNEAAPVATARAPAPTEAPRAPTLPSAGNEPGKRIVTLVPQGQLPHLVTADGTRYFVGAVLPTGHRVAAVMPQTLVLERDGQQTRIDF